MNNIQKAFKAKSKLRGMADGGQVDPRILGSGMAQRAGSALQGRRAQLDAAIDAASGAPPPRPAPTPVTAAPVKKPEEKSALRSFFGLADGGQVFKNTVGGVPTYTDARAATAGATAHTPGSGGGTFSVIGMEPAQKQQMADAAAQRQAAANAPTTLGGRLDAALGKLNSPAAATGAPSSTPTLGSELDAAIGRTQGVTSAQTPATGAPANDVNRIMNSRDMSTFTPQERKTFNSMGQAAMADAAQMRDIGVQAGEAAAAAARPASPLQSSNFDEPSFELEFADGGKVKGKGGPTDDKVGPVMLSDGEYVLPADTVDIVGRDKLDALRLATHDFVDEDNKPKVSNLRKMANGGPVTSGISVEELNDPASRRAFQQARVAASMGNHFGAQTILNDAIPRHQFAPEPPPAASPKPPTEVSRPQAGGSSKLGGVGRAAGALRGLGLVGNAVAAIPAMDASVGEWARGIPGVLRGEAAPQPNTKVRFLDGQPAAELRTPEPVFNPTPAELDRRGALRPVSVDDAMGNLRSGDAPGGGFQQVPGTDVYRRNNPNAGNPGESARQYIGVGTPAPQEDPIMGEIRSALRGLTDGAGNRGGGASVSSNAREINARYDALAKQLSGMYGREGQGNLARRLLELEQSRSGALDADQRNRSALRGQDMQASTAANNANMQARMQALQTLGTMANQRSQQGAQAQAAADKARADAAAAERSASETGVKDLDDYIKTAFPDDPKEADRFRSFVQSAGPELIGELTTQHGGDRRRAFEDMRQRLLIQDRGGGGNIFTGQRSSGYDPVADVNLDPGVADILSAWWDGGMGARDTFTSMLKEFSPFDNALATHDSGQVRPASKLRGGDMRSTKTIEDMVADRPRREALRRAATDN